MNWTEEEYRALQSRQKAPAVKRSKYGGVKTELDGITFDSKREAQRYRELKLQQHAGQIRDLRWQPHYTLFALTLEGADLHNANAGDISLRRQPVCEYIADFEYLAASVGVEAVTWSLVVEDVKSPATRKKDVYRLKRKLFEAQYGVEIREIR